MAVRMDALASIDRLPRVDHGIPHHISDQWHLGLVMLGNMAPDAEQHHLLDVGRFEPGIPVTSMSGLCDLVPLTPGLLHEPVEGRSVGKSPDRIAHAAASLLHRVTSRVRLSNAASRS